MTIDTVVLLIGEADRAEMRPVVRYLEQLVATASRLITAQDIAGGIRALASGEFPDLTVVLQSGPNEFSATDVQMLLSFAPLSRVVVCYGAWCESDGRNHQVWPLAVRSPVWAACSRLQREWQLVSGRSDSLPLPWSASREEIFAADHEFVATNNPTQSYLIDSPDPALRQFLGECLASEGHHLVTEAPTRILFDADPWGAARQAALRTMRERHPHAVITAALTLYDPYVEADLLQRGVSTVIPKLRLGTAS